MEQNKINPNQLKAIATMCNTLNINKETKAIMVNGFSNGRCTSSKDLLFSEAMSMLKHLDTLIPKDDRCVKMQGKILYYAHEMGWQKLNHKYEKVTDMKRVDDWMIKYSYLKKKLYKYSYSELPKLVSQFENVYKAFLSKL